VGVTAQDSGLYLKKAYEFSQGQIDWGFRPGFIVLFAVAFKTMGVSVWAATVVVRMFFFANTALIFCMTRHIINKQAGFAASLTLFTSYYLAYLSHRVLLDNIHPFFVLLAIFFSTLSIDRNSDKLSLTAGFVFIYAYLVKSTTLLFLPFPFLLVILYEGIRLNFLKIRQAVIICATSLAGIAAYHFFQIFAGGRTQAQNALGGHSGEALNLVFTNTFAGTFQNVLRGFLEFWNNFLFQDTWLGWLFVVAWGWMVIRSIKHKRSRAVVVILILFLPAMLYLGLTGLRLGQAGIFLFATFICVGALIYDLGKGIGKILLAGDESKARGNIVSASAIIVLYGFSRPIWVEY
jgi:4-amino-4-deoxy-L-arabinose transferase-like glycosyltransferase